MIADNSHKKPQRELGVKNICEKFLSIIVFLMFLLAKIAKVCHK